MQSVKISNVLTTITPLSFPIEGPEVPLLELRGANRLPFIDSALAPTWGAIYKISHIFPLRKMFFRNVLLFVCLKITCGLTKKLSRAIISIEKGRYR